MAPRLNAIILAAGLSSRMGRLKASLPLGGNTILGQCINLFKSVGIHRPLVVCGHESEKVAQIGHQLDAEIVHNDDFATGMYSSILAGVSSLTKKCDACFLLPVDIPLVQPATVKQMIKSFKEKPSHLFYPTFTGERGHPPLISKELLPIILANHNPEGGLRTLLSRVEQATPERVAEIAVPDSNILFDMDSPGDYAAGLLRWHQRDYPSAKECASILQLHPMVSKGMAHGHLVGRIASALCQAIQKTALPPLDPELCLVCGLLHDIAKGHPQHERAGGRLLRSYGFTRAAEIIEAHKDIDWHPGMTLGEKELVHLADKLARGSRIVGIAERFEEKLHLFAENPDALAAIKQRYKKARQLAVAVEQQSKKTIGEILANLDLPVPCGP